MTQLRLAISSIVLFGILYVAAILGFARTFVPEKASGSLVANAAGGIVGSRLIAQGFTSDRYFHPRPSACGYDARASAGSNLSPTNPELAARARTIIAAAGADPSRPLPADLVTASGSGLDPDITREAAVFQTNRIARARGISREQVAAMLPAGPLANVLELNLALDRRMLHQ